MKDGDKFNIQASGVAKLLICLLWVRRRRKRKGQKEVFFWFFLSLFYFTVSTRYYQSMLKTKECRVWDCKAGMQKPHTTLRVMVLTVRPFTHLFFHSFSQPMFTDHLVNTRCCARHRWYLVNMLYLVLDFMECTVQWGRQSIG